MKPEDITEGIFFGLEESVYHAAPYCGSSNLKTLGTIPGDYWWDSPMNPLREIEEESSAMRFGTALHARILHGLDYFKQHYRYVEGERGDAVSAEGLKEWIKGQGGTPAKLKADNEKMVREQFGINLVTERVYERLAVSAEQILKNPHLVQAFSTGWPEVSIFWLDQDDPNEAPVPMKARFDYWKLRTIVDLKSIGPRQRVMSFDGMVIQDIKRLQYTVQLASYIKGHAAARKLAQDGKVWVAPGSARPTDEWLQKALSEDVNWTWVFYKSDGMPIARSYQVAHGSSWHEDGKSRVARALQNYRDCMAKFGTDTAWVDTSPPYPLDEEDFKWRD